MHPESRRIGPHHQHAKERQAQRKPGDVGPGDPPLRLRLTRSASAAAPAAIAEWKNGYSYGRCERPSPRQSARLAALNQQRPGSTARMRPEEPGRRAATRTRFQATASSRRPPARRWCRRATPLRGQPLTAKRNEIATRAIVNGEPAQSKIGQPRHEYRPVPPAARARAAPAGWPRRRTKSCGDPQHDRLDNRDQPQYVGHRGVVVAGAEEHEIRRRHEVKDG